MLRCKGSCVCKQIKNQPVWKKPPHVPTVRLLKPKNDKDHEVDENEMCSYPSSINKNSFIQRENNSNDRQRFTLYNNTTLDLFTKTPILSSERLSRPVKRKRSQIRSSEVKKLSYSELSTKYSSSSKDRSPDLLDRNASNSDMTDGGKSQLCNEVEVEMFHNTDTSCSSSPEISLGTSRALSRKERSHTDSHLRPSNVSLLLQNGNSHSEEESVSCRKQKRLKNQGGPQKIPDDSSSSSSEYSNREPDEQCQTSLYDLRGRKIALSPQFKNVVHISNAKKRYSDSGLSNKDYSNDEEEVKRSLRSTRHSKQRVLRQQDHNGIVQNRRKNQFLLSLNLEGNSNTQMQLSTPPKMTCNLRRRKLTKGRSD